MKSSNLLRNIPSVSELLESPPLKGLVDRVSHNVVVSGVRSFLEDLRLEIDKAAQANLPPVRELAERIARRIVQEEQPKLRPVINATGILLHTGLGRAPLADEAIEALVASARDYASVEIDLASGERSQRAGIVSDLLAQLTGAEAAFVVNNNAAATLLTLAAVAQGREVIVSRGQLIEIGGSFRLPDVMAASGATLREVGTTNKTRASDYADAINEDTAALLKVHPSNFRVMGFTAEVSLEEMVRIARQRQLPVIDDIGSGALIDFTPYGCPGEPVARDSIETGADLVLFSGDKLLGGPQCGVIVGRRKLVEQVARHPLARALRVDKLTLAALTATLRLYRDPRMALQRVPLLQLLCTGQDNLKNRAERLAPQLQAAPAVEFAAVVEDVTYLGGGSVPTQQIPTWCIALAPVGGNVDRLARALRTGEVPVVGRVQQGQLRLDLRSVFPRQDVPLVEAVQAVPAPAGWSKEAEPAE